MAEILIKVSDYVHSDPEKDRGGVHKRCDIINIKPDGWSSHLNWITSEYPYSKNGKFITIKVPDLTEAEVLHLRDSWQDDYDYEIVATYPAQGRYDLRVFEKNIGGTFSNNISGNKATKINNYLSKWGCTNIVQNAHDVNFSFLLWNAVRSPNFWNVSQEQLNSISFALNSYINGVGNITATTSEIPTAERTESQITKNIEMRILERGGSIVSSVYPNYIFTIERSDIISKFREDVKQKTQRVYTRHRHCISENLMNTVITNFGMYTMTGTEFLAEVRDKMI